MAKPSIVVFPPIPPELRATLIRSFELVEPGAGPLPPELRVAVITSVGGADAALMDKLPNLGLIACNGTGVERIDLREAARRGIVVRNTPDEVTDDTADFAVGLIYATCRRMAEADRFVRAGRWNKERMTPSRRVFGRHIGIVGLGRIGQKVAERATGAGMKVSYTGPRRKPDKPYGFHADPRQLAAAVEVLVLCCPSGPETFHLIDADVLRALGPDGILINVSRGDVVDEEALIHALSNGLIGGAGLDVFAREPNADERLFAMANVVLAPHYASVTLATRQAIADALHDSIQDFLNGQPVVHDAAIEFRPRAAS
jgi:hydroxypyruvate reductase